MHGHPCTHSTVPVTPQSHLTATQSPGRGALHKQLQLTTDLISEALMSLIEIFFFFFPSPREKAVAEFVSWEISVSVSNLEDEWNNQLKKKRKKKKASKGGSFSVGG